MSILDGEGGYSIPERSPIATGLKREFRRLLKKQGRKSLIKLYLEKGVYNFYLKVRDIKAVSAVDGGSEVAEPTNKSPGVVAALTVRQPRAPSPPQLWVAESGGSHCVGSSASVRGESHCVGSSASVR